MRLYIGIDDTDSPNKVYQEKGKGTGRIARNVAHLLQTKFSLTVYGITRHQLPKHILDTKTNNSSKCIHAEINYTIDLTDLANFIVDILKREIHSDSNTGVAILLGSVDKDAIMLAKRIQKEQVTMNEV